MKNIKIEEAFAKEISLLWSSEKVLLRALPEMIAQAVDFGLKTSLALHLAETEQQKTALEFILKQMEHVPTDETATELNAMITSGNQKISEEKAGKARDMAIVGVAKEVERYEISGYTAAAAHAEQLGLKLVAKRLYAIRLEEQQAEGKLNFLAKNIIGANSQIGAQSNL